MAKTASPSYEEPEKNVAHQQVLPPTKARAGLMDSNTLLVLGISTILTAILFGVIFYLYARGL